MSETGNFSASAIHRPHLVALDSVRGLAAVAVVIFHFGAISSVFGRTFTNGYLMVDLFFVLSGFAISYAYQDRLGTVSEVKRFLWLRFWRLYPLHLATLLYFVILELAKLPLAGLIKVNHPAFSANTVDDLFANLFLLQAMNVLHADSFNGPAWSISAEFWTYLLFAGVAFLLPGRLRLWIACAAISLISGACLVAFWPGLTPRFDFGWLRCLAGFFLGALCYATYETLSSKTILRRHGKAVGWAALAALLLFSIFIAGKKPESISDFAVIPFAALAILLISLAPPASMVRILCVPPLRWLGAISYSLYMVHSCFLYAWPRLWKPPQDFQGQLVQLIAYLVIVAAAASVTFRWIETPFRAWSRTPAAAARISAPASG